MSGLLLLLLLLLLDRASRRYTDVGLGHAPL